MQLSFSTLYSSRRYSAAARDILRIVTDLGLVVGAIEGFQEHEASLKADLDGERALRTQGEQRIKQLESDLQADRARINFLETQCAQLQSDLQKRDQRIISLEGDQREFATFKKWADSMPGNKENVKN